MPAFGGPVRLFSADAADGTSALSPAEDVDRIRRLLLDVSGAVDGSLRIYRPRPTAAFSPRDTTLGAYGAAAEAMARLGFAPVERRAGGSLAVYDEAALVIDLVAPHDSPRQDVLARFRRFSEAIAGTLRDVGIDVRVGAVPGEYCPGDFSINAAGRCKLAGLAQRIGKRGYHLGAVVGVAPSAAVTAAVTEAYRILGFGFDPQSIGSLQDIVPGVDVTQLRQALLAAVAQCVPVLSPCGSEVRGPSPRW